MKDKDVETELSRPVSSRSRLSSRYSGVDEFARSPEQDPSKLETGRKWSLELPSPHPQLTVKAVFSGCMVGIICSFLALYYGLKTGIVPSLNILSGLGGFVFLKALIRVGLIKGVFTPQENAVVQTAAVATYAASSPSFGFTSSYLAMLPNSYKNLGELEGNDPNDVIQPAWWKEFLWCIGLGFFGFFIAFPLREYSVLKQRLIFPSGTATAYVIKSMHSSAAKAKHSFAILSKFFCIAFLVNCVTWMFEGLAQFPMFGLKGAKYGWTMDWDLGSFGIGFILSNKVNISIFLGGVIAFGIMKPVLEATIAKPISEGGWYDPEFVDSPYLDSTAYTLFGGLAIMIVQGGVSIILLCWVLLSESEWYRNKRGTEEKDTSLDLDPEELERQELLDQIFLESKIPWWVPIVGYVSFGVVCILIFSFLFMTPWYQILVALLIIPIFAISNIQGMGRTDWDVASSYGKLIMFPFGAWNSGGSIIPSLVACIVTISGCSNSGVLMQDFKTGYLLGATPTKMFYAQMIGQFFGCIVTPTLFTLLNTAYEIPGKPTDFIPGLYGPIYRTLAIVATRGGFSSLPKNTVQVSCGFILLALVLDLGEIFGPEKVAEWIPDPTAMAIGMLVGAGPPLKFFMGGMIKAFWSHYEPEICAERSPYIASGFIAGSGIAVVLQCIVSLAKFESPIFVSYSLNTGFSMKPYMWFLAFVFLLVPGAVFVCAACFWFPPPKNGVDEDGVPKKDSSIRLKKMNSEVSEAPSRATKDE